MKLNMFQRFAVRKLLGREWLRWIMEALAKLEDAGYGDRPPVDARATNEEIAATVRHLGIDREASTPKLTGATAGERIWRGDAVYLGQDGKYYRSSNPPVTEEATPEDCNRVHAERLDAEMARLEASGDMDGTPPRLLTGEEIWDRENGVDATGRPLAATDGEDRLVADRNRRNRARMIAEDEAPCGTDAGGQPLPATDVTTTRVPTSGEWMNIGGKDIYATREPCSHTLLGHLKVPDLMPITVGKAPGPAKQGENRPEPPTSVDDKPGPIPYDDPETGVRYPSHVAYLDARKVRFPD